MSPCSEQYKKNGFNTIIILLLFNFINVYLNLEEAITGLCASKYQARKEERSGNQLNDEQYHCLYVCVNRCENYHDVRESLNPHAITIVDNLKYHLKK